MSAARIDNDSSRAATNPISAISSVAAKSFRIAAAWTALHRISVVDRVRKSRYRMPALIRLVIQRLWNIFVTYD